MTASISLLSHLLCHAMLAVITTRLAPITSAHAQIAQAMMVLGICGMRKSKSWPESSCYCWYRFTCLPRICATLCKRYTNFNQRRLCECRCVWLQDLVENTVCQKGVWQGWLWNSLRKSTNANIRNKCMFLLFLHFRWDSSLCVKALPIVKYCMRLHLDVIRPLI